MIFRSEINPPNTCLLVLFTVVTLPLAGQTVMPDKFLYGASTYPELQTREEWNRMLDLFQAAHFTVVRVSESSWGNLETAPGKYNFAWLKDYLDDVERHGMKAILGTSSYIAPQWLAAKHPEILTQYVPGVGTHPMVRKAACINQPLYREAVRRYVSALGREFKQHPAVIGWQLDNEIEFTLNKICYCSACERKWRDWLRNTYHTADEFNRRLDLVSWGMRVESIDDVPQPRSGGESDLPALRLANLHFRRDGILEFLSDQRQALRESGARQWITTDWNTVWDAIADDPKARELLNLSGLNFYQPSAQRPEYFRDLAWHMDMHRSTHGLGYFLATETRVGVAGDTIQWDAFPSHEQFRMWMLQAAAYGAFGLMYWSGNRWQGGHWPQWGGVLDWTGHPEPDFPWVVEIGEFFAKNSEQLLRNPVHATAAVLTDFDQRAALDKYKHTPSSSQIVPETFDALHRLGIGVDSVNLQRAAQAGALSRYALVVIPAAAALDSNGLVLALRQYVEAGGHVVITPFTAYQTWDGVFRSDGFGANLAELTGAIARTGWRMGTSADSGRDQKVEWLGNTSPVGIDGYCEYLEISPGAEVAGVFKSSEPALNGKPAVVRRHLGKGSVTKLAFWPADDSVLALFDELEGSERLLARGAPQGVQAIPHADGTVFVINTAGAPARIQLTRRATDRMSGRNLDRTVELKGYEVFWLE